MSSSSSHIPRSSTKLVMWEGFEDELSKIAVNLAAPLKGPATPTSLTKIKKTLYNEKSALSARKPSYSRVHTDIPSMGQVSDPLSSTKMTPPPPVTAGL